MDDHIARVDQNPVAMGQAFDSEILDAQIFQPPLQAIRQRPDMAMRTARGDDHHIGEGSLAGKIDLDDVLGLVVVKRLERRGAQLVDDDCAVPVLFARAAAGLDPIMRKLTRFA
ncbi:MAG: hypothetical protein Tsb0010_16770 [Parvularculaceae bacterium]